MAVVGPTHPYKGGVAAHTTELARHLAAAGHETDLVSWSRLYPALLYPGEQVVPDGAPDLAPYGRTTRPLSWARPDSWVRVGRSLRGHDLVVVVHVVPAVAPAHLALLRALRSGSRSGAGRRPRVVVVAHNVLPHEPHPGAAALVRALLSIADATLVHTQDQAQAARALGAHQVGVAPLPPHLPGGPKLPHRSSDGPPASMRRAASAPPASMRRAASGPPASMRRAASGPPALLALGIVRPYKGVDVLLEALAEVPGPTLTIAGELWGAAGEQVRELAARLGDRVELRAGYVPATALAGLLAAHDVLALPYRSATASQNALLGFAHGLPVLATRVGTFAEEVSDGVDGVLAEPDSVESLAFALRRLCEPGAVDRLRDGVRAPDLTTPWRAYLTELAALAHRPADRCPA